jgi:hypothetical protein
MVVNSNAALHVVYLGCEGVLVRSAAGTVLIDGLFGQEAAPFGVPQAADLDGLRHARSPFDGVDAVIATHHHGDHFDPGAVADYLRASSRTRFVSTPQAVERLIDHAGAAFVDRVYAVQPVDGLRERVEVNGVGIEGFGLSPFWFLTYPFGKRLMQRGLQPRAAFAVHIRVSEREQVVNEILAEGAALPLTEPLSRYRVAGDGTISREE